MSIHEGHIVRVTYVSVWDDDITCESEAQYDTLSKRVLNIDTADNCNQLTDEFIVLPNGAELHESNGITFEYKEN